jgi:PEP-CTERM motif
VATAVNSLTITPGVYSTVTVDASIPLGSAFIGQPISLQLGIPAEGAANSQVVYDNVRVTSSGTAVPEPSTWVLTGIGFVALAAMGRARSSSIARRDS